MGLIYNLTLTEDSLKTLKGVLEDAAAVESNTNGPIHNELEYLKAMVEETRRVSKRKDNPNIEAYREAAWERYQGQDYDIEEDAEVLPGPLGAYVQGWLWVPKKDLKKEAK